MDFLILKYLDILIGLAVVMLMGSVLVTAVTQFVLSVSYARARYLRDGLTSIIQQLDRKRFDEKTASYVASRLLRNPIVGRAPTLPGKAFTALRNWARWVVYKPALPSVNPTDVIQREELVLFLLQWAAGEGLLLTQDNEEELAAPVEKLNQVKAALGLPAGSANETRINGAIQCEMERTKGSPWKVFSHAWRALEDLTLSPWTRLTHSIRIGRAINRYRYASQACKARETIKAVLKDLGVESPADALKSIRELATTNERQAPDAASRKWFADAISATVSAQFLGRVNTWFDNVVARVSDNFSLEAKIWASATALLIAVSVQLDSLALLKRLEVDDKLRSALVADADRESKTYEVAQQKLKDFQDARKKQADKPSNSNDTQASLEENRAKVASDLAEDAKIRIAEQLAVMREPKFAIVPNFFIWQRVAQFDVLEKYLYNEDKTPGCGSYGAVLKVDAKQYPIRLERGAKRRLIELATAIRSSGAPVTMWQDSTRLRVVAATPEILEINFVLPANDDCGLFSVASRTWSRSAAWDLIPPRMPDAPLAFRFQDIDGLFQRWPGILLSFVLLSLGGPFWFNILKTALNFRSVLAAKDDAERKARQTDQAADTNGNSTKTPSK